ncbi:MAG: sigma-70 family RNA polymerase sigma factor [Gemmatimonadetes bacterium]|nr:sigma-70 family RNA polymerase sigma factor [Gemmatimonadota bacterium]
MSGSLFDRTLLGALYQQHHEELFRYAARFTGDADLAEDVVQEAFLRLSERPPAQTEAIRAWLFRAATTIAIDTHRTRRRRTALAEAGADRLPMAEQGPDPARSAERADLRRRVRTALEQLDARDRAVLLMREEGFAHREIAEAVGTTTKSVGTMIARALGKLARHLELTESDV